jgi:imidazolonepropionase-like amidohydrolase
VTQKSWGEKFIKRYPKTRPGVEEFIRDQFASAVDYEAKWKGYQALPAKVQAQTIPPRRDLGMEALCEIIHGRRLVHCHAYRGDEMLALLRVAEHFGFRVASFEHALEAYKIADEMAAHGVAGCLASDWWAYKPEAYDGIPYNAALLYQRGVLTCFGSDSPELARRLNLEAAKAERYGGVPPEEALKMVTLNSARELGIDRWVGSLEPGKDADFAVWSGDPLSTASICLQTWIDGKKYFDREEDLKARAAVEAERQELLAKAGRAAESGQSGEHAGNGRKRSGGRP